METLSPNGELFGFERTLDVLRSRQQRSPAQTVYGIYQASCNFAEDAPQLDDITAVVIKAE